MAHPEPENRNVATEGSLPSPEPILEADEIQGNIVPGFLKPFMALSALSIEEVGLAKDWIARIAPTITTLAQAMPSRMKVRAHRGLRPHPATEVGGLPPDLDDAWVNVTFSYPGLAKLLAGNAQRTRELGEFRDIAFQLGLTARSPFLGDPT